MLQFMALVITIPIYYLEPSPYTKAFPALSLACLSSTSELRAGLLLASFGDYYLGLDNEDWVNDENIDGVWISGILSFLGFHLFLIYSTRFWNWWPYINKKFYIGINLLFIILIAASGYISYQVGLMLFGPILIYTLTLSFELCISILGVQVERRARKDKKFTGSTLTYPNRFPIGVLIFIISDILVLGNLIDIEFLSRVEFLGLPLYWTSLFIILRAYVS